ncbi:MAG: subfamily B ATP-binding cassette protein HlyB/CyaB [Limisphaerales bacterium]|jgi:subfamily B ATP-binding cassette protein HlyB/CyaB
MSDQTSRQDEDLVEFLSNVEMLSAFSTDDLNDIAGQVETSWFEFGDEIFEAGQASAGTYVIKVGTLRLFTKEGGKEVSMGLRRAGDVIAELAALRESDHEFSVRASSKTELIFIPREAFAPILEKDPNAASFLTSYVALRAVGGVVNRLFDLRGKVEKEDLEKLVRSVGAKRVTAGSTVLQQGSLDDKRLYVVRQGELDAEQEIDGTKYPLGTLRDGDTFGEVAALKRQQQSATVVAKSDVVLLIIPEDTLRVLLELNPQVKDLLEARIVDTERDVERQQKVAEHRGRRVLLDLSSKPRAGEKILPRFGLVEQAEEADCGAACLAMICKHYDLSMTLGKLREMASVTTEGATLDSLAKAGESLGFSTRGVKCTYESLVGFQLPFIAHWEGYHYITVYGVSKRHVWVADPARGFSKMSVADFEKGWTGNCLLFTPTADLAATATVQSPWVRFAGYVRPYTNVIGYILLATFVIEILGVMPPIIVQNVLDRVVVHANFELLNILMFGLVIAHFFARLTSLMRGFLTIYMTRNIDLSMLSHFFQHTLALPLSFFNTRRTGDIFARFQENLTVRSFLTESTITTVLNVLMTFIYFTVMFLYNVKLTMLMIALVIPMLVLTLAITPRIKYYARLGFETSTDAEAVLMETISGAETVKAMGIERSMRMRWESRYVKSLDVQYRSARFDLYVGFVGQLLNVSATVAVLWVGANMVLTNELTIGQLIAFNMLMGSALSPLMGIISLWDELHETGVAMERLGDVLDVEPEQRPQDAESRIILPEVRGHLRFEDVFFRYGGNETSYILESVNLDIEPGQLIAIVGQSGSGKTTLAKLIAGFYPPTEGKISLDGYDMAQIDKETYRSQLGYVMQNNLLFSGSVAENIAAGEDNPDRRRVIEVAKLADAHNFILQMPLGYDQTVGERGMGLSGGQMQRLCIARALYRDPSVLILDEATSALDSQSESAIMSNMQSVLSGRTSIVIAHRLSTIMEADKILVLFEGNIVEEGVHQELIERGGMYQQLVSKQMAGFS